MRSNLRRMALAALLAAAVLGFGPGAAQAQDISVFVDGNRLNQSPLMVGGRTLVPLRGIFEALGATVVWEGATRTVRAQRGQTSIELTLGNPMASVNGQPVTLDVPAQSVGGLTMVPLRFIGEALGADVDWRPATRTILITSAGGGGGGGPEPPPTAGPVTINKVVVSPQRALNVGDTLTVIATGTPGGQASFDIVGVRTGIAMPEVSSGRYQGTLAIGQGLSANAATLMVRLARDGQEDLAQASTTVTIGKSGGGVTPGQLGEFPAPNSVTAETRPTIGANFQNGVTAGNVRMWVDGREVTNELAFQGNQVAWRPNYDLSSGQHNVRLSGSDNFGNDLERQWAFTIGQGGPSGTSRFPASGTTTTTARPAIGMSFPQAVRTETARLWVDGQDFTNQAQVTPWQISWTPAYDLSAGSHSVRVDATTQNGQFLNEVWSFTIGTGGGTGGGSSTTGLITNVTLTPDPPYSLGQTAQVTLTGTPGGQATFSVGGRTGIPMQEIQSGVYRGSYTVGQGDQSSYMQITLRMPDGRTQTVQSQNVIQISGTGGTAGQLQVLSPTNNANVDPNFNVVGRAPAGATVQVQAQVRQALIPGVISIPGRTITNSVRADSNGNFNVPIGAADLASGTILYLTVVAQDSFGNQSAPVTFQVRRN